MWYTRVSFNVVVIISEAFICTVVVIISKAFICTVIVMISEAFICTAHKQQAATVPSPSPFLH